MTIPDIFAPSPFDPTPPLDRTSAAGMGAAYGAMIGQLDAEMHTNGGDLAALAQSHLDSAQQGGAITADDAVRLRALLSPTDEGPDATVLLREALSDAGSSALAVAILSIASYRQRHHQADTSDVSDAYAGYVVGLSGGLLPYFAIEVAKHIQVTWRP